MIVAYLVLLVAGALLCNAIPHLVSGLRGERFHTPWARPRGVGRSSALENFLWGAASLLVAVFLLDRTLGANIPHGLMALALGFVGAGVALSLVFGAREQRR